jgi:hypothetical protein
VIEESTELEIYGAKSKRKTKGTLNGDFQAGTGMKLANPLRVK